MTQAARMPVRPRRTRLPLFFAVLMGLMGVRATEAKAAVRTCGETIAVTGEDRRSETTAKQKAMAGWIAAAVKLGPAFAAWRNAIDKSLSCLKLTDGTWRCQAYGRPCGISQVPGVDPPGVPARPSKSKGIES